MLWYIIKYFMEFFRCFFDLYECKFLVDLELSSIIKIFGGFSIGFI